ncbi:MAG: isoprenoid biosynthesis glyoxalase ElbB [Bacteroidota bacterium]
MKKFAVVLSGSGVYDGAEIHEATLSLLAIAEAGAEYEIFAPDIQQYHVINHLNGEEMNEKRNVLIESARIARGKISPLSSFNAQLFDALLFPGGFGAAKNLSNLAFKGPDCVVNKDVERCIIEMFNAKKPIGALCIAPALIAKVLKGANVTIGNDKGTIEAIETMGGTHLETTHGEVIEDKAKKIFTTPCYMLDASIIDIRNGAQNIVKAIMGSI